MSLCHRESSYCSELDRSPEELLAFAALDRAQRPARVPTHGASTLERYLRVCMLYARFCLERGRPVLVRNPPRAAALLLDFLKYMREQQGATSSVTRDLPTPINTWYFTRDLPRPESRALTLYLRALRKEHVRKQATPVTPDHVKAMCRCAAATRPRMMATRDIALILHAFATAKRPSEVRLFRCEDIRSAPQGMRIVIPQSKADPYRDGQIVTITRAYEELYCPVRSLERWLAVSHIKSGIVFRAVSRAGTVGPDRPLSRNSYESIIKTYLQAVGLTGKCTGYSLRRGYATSAYAYGASHEEIQQQLRHKHRETTDLYIDRLPIPFERSITGILLS